MSMTAARADVTVRPFVDTDEAATLQLLSASLGSGPAGSRSPEFFRWKHYENSFGRSFMLVAERSGEIVGLRAFMRWAFIAQGGTYRGLRAVDTATHPEHQGRGIFSLLTRSALDALTGEADLVFNTPNAASKAGYLKMGWQPVGTFSVPVRVSRPVRFARNARSLKSAVTPTRERPVVDAPAAGEVLADRSMIGRLLESAKVDDDRFRTLGSVDYLMWRYGRAPSLDYRALTIATGGELEGLVIFRVRPRGPLWETSIVELICAPGDFSTARKLLRRSAAAAASDHITCAFVEHGELSRAGLPTGFVPSPVGVGFVVRPLRDEIAPDPTHLGSWALRLGDLEVF
jgi:GNAT superfamily N-acetyltransferase